MSAEENKALVLRFYEEVFNQKHTAAISELFDPNMVDHALPPGLPSGIEGAKQLYSMYLAAFPDLHFTVEDIIAAAAAGGIKIVMATHDLGQARRLAGDIIFLVAGLVVERASAAQFFASPATEQARSFLAGDLVI